MLGPLASPASIASCSVPRPAKGPEPTLNTGCANHELAHRVFPSGLACRAKPARNIAVILIIRKLNKKDYIIIKAYRLIALLNIIRKLLELIITRKLSKLVKSNGILSEI
jgi:hypothetical protein